MFDGTFLSVKVTHFNPLVLSCFEAIAHTSPMPPAFTMAEMVVATMPNTMMVVWKASVQTTAFSPPWNIKKMLCVYSVCTYKEIECLVFV